MYTTPIIKKATTPKTSPIYLCVYVCYKNMYDTSDKVEYLQDNSTKLNIRMKQKVDKAKCHKKNDNLPQNIRICQDYINQLNSQHYFNKKTMWDNSTDMFRILAL